MSDSLCTHNGRTMDQAASDLVQREIHVCLSSMVATLAQAYGQADRSDSRLRDLDDLAEQAFELAAPVLDYEEAARQAGWHQEGDRWFFGEDHRTNPSIAGCSNAEEACHEDDLVPYQCEVYEHWAVSTWLAEKLQAAGERVDTDFAGLNVWARTTTGQATSMDAVIQRITAELHAPSEDDRLQSELRAAGLEVRHDMLGYYACTDEEAQTEDKAGGASCGFDGRPHFPMIADAARHGLSQADA